MRLPMRISRAIRPKDVLSRKATDPRWLAAQGGITLRAWRMLATPKRLAWLWDRVTTTKATFNGGNSSAWKADILQINGFDESMGYGGQDRELGERLVNLGLRGKQVRHRAVCVHLDHARTYADRAILEYNRALRRKTRQTRATWTPNGIYKYDSFEQYLESRRLITEAPHRRAAA